MSLLDVGINMSLTHEHNDPSGGTPCMRFTVLDSPLGGLLAVRDDGGLTGLYLPTGRHVVSPHSILAAR